MDQRYNHEQYSTPMVVIPAQNTSQQRSAQFRPSQGQNVPYDQGPQNGYQSGMAPQMMPQAPPNVQYMPNYQQAHAQQWTHPTHGHSPQQQHIQGQYGLQQSQYFAYDGSGQAQVPTQYDQYGRPIFTHQYAAQQQQQQQQRQAMHPQHNAQQSVYQPPQQQPAQRTQQQARPSQQVQQRDSLQELSAQFQVRKSSASTPKSFQTTDQAPRIILPPNHSPHTPHPSAKTRIPQTSAKPPTPSTSASKPSKALYTPKLGLNYRLVLLQTADEFLAEAQRIAPALVSVEPPNQDADTYYKLMANALACYESVLAHPTFRGSPRQEAELRLRVNAIKFSETDEDDELEADLTRGITKCERHRLYDLKYSMEHLLVRLLWKSKAKAGLRYLEKAVEQAKAQNHVAWIYAFHFLRVTLLLQSPSAQDHRSAFGSLRAIDEAAQRQRDSSILCLCSLMEALIHHQVKAQDFSSEADRALASARAHMMSAGDRALPQLGAMVHIVDLISSLDPYSPKVASPKVKAFEAFFDESIRKGQLPSTGVISLPLRMDAAQAQVMHTAGIFTTNSSGACFLNFQWLDKVELFALGYLTNGIEAYAKNPSQAMHNRCETMLGEGLRMIAEDETKRAQPNRTNQHLLAGLADKSRRRLQLKAYMSIYRALASTTRSVWSEAAASLREVMKIRKTLGSLGPPTLSAFVTFIQAVMHHQSGDFESALRCYQSPELALDVEPRRFGPTTHHELSILSSLGIIMITWRPNHPLHNLAIQQRELLKQIFRMEGQSIEILDSRLNPQLVGACALVMATTQDARSASDGGQKSILNTKSYIQKALSISKTYGNLLIGSAAISYMHESLFSGQAGGNALNSALASKQTADNSGSVMWQATTAGMTASAYEKTGQFDEARRAFGQGLQVAAQLPRRVQEQLGLVEDVGVRVVI